MLIFFSTQFLKEVLPQVPTFPGQAHLAQPILAKTLHVQLLSNAFYLKLYEMMLILIDRSLARWLKSGNTTYSNLDWSFLPHFQCSVSMFHPPDQQCQKSIKPV